MLDVAELLEVAHPAALVAALSTLGSKDLAAMRSQLQLIDEARPGLFCNDRRVSANSRVLGGSGGAGRTSASGKR